jgi:hypothetical protein
LIRLNRFALVGALLAVLGLTSVTLSGGCSSDEVPHPTEAQAEVQRKEIIEQTNANDAASKANATKRSALPP